MHGSVAVLCGDPYGNHNAGGVVFGSVAYNSPAGKLLTNFNFRADFDTSNDAQAVWAEFTSAGTGARVAYAVGSGLVIVMRCWRKG